MAFDLAAWAVIFVAVWVVGRGALALLDADDVRAPPEHVVRAGDRLILAAWVGVGVCAITLLGARQLRDLRVSRTRLLLLPAGLGAYALISISAVFGATAAPAWLAGVALAFALNRLLRWPRDVQLGGDGTFLLRGSVWPLLLMWTIFALRYAATVTLVLHPALLHDPTMGAGFSAVYGVLSGLFAARAWRVLQSARPAVALQAA